MQKLLILLFDYYYYYLTFSKFNLDDRFNMVSHYATHYHNTYLKCLISMYA